MPSSLPLWVTASEEIEGSGGIRKEMLWSFSSRSSSDVTEPGLKPRTRLKVPRLGSYFVTVDDLRWNRKFLAMFFFTEYSKTHSSKIHRCCHDSTELHNCHTSGTMMKLRRAVPLLTWKTEAIMSNIFIWIDARVTVLFSFFFFFLKCNNENFQRFYIQCFRLALYWEEYPDLQEVIFPTWAEKSYKNFIYFYHWLQSFWGLCCCLWMYINMDNINHP